MNYEESLAYLYNRLPIFQNQGARAYKPGLSTTLAFCERLANPQDTYKTIHVGGTNGKGSTSHMLASILQHAGYRVGLYTSPHLKSFTERIRVNGQSVQEDFVARFVTEHQTYIEEIEPSFFEVTVAMAFDYFSAESVDVAVIEVGMGGRLDSTNVITPVLSLVTNISFDHTQYLGDTLPKIAWEKAGIMKPSVPFVLSEQMAADVLRVFKDRAKELKTNVTIGGERIRVLSHHIHQGKLTVEVIEGEDPVPHTYELDLLGDYQLTNLQGVLTALELLKRSGFELPQTAIEAGLATVCSTTGLKGRWQKIGSRPLVICDTAHNPAGLALTVSQFKQIPARVHRYVLGFVADKTLDEILPLFSPDDVYYFCQPTNSRALPVESLVQAAKKVGIGGVPYENVNLALQKAVADSDLDDAIYVGGSTFVVADLESI